MTYGASVHDWTHFDLILGLGEDILPVVSNPKATISPASKLRDLGKTPSIYNQQGQVAGIPGWTSLRANGKEFSAWSVQPDYGICVQTRTVRGIDIDVPDRALALAIAGFIDRHLGQVLPMRQRENSGKCLMAVTVEGELAYRRMIVEGGVVELLAHGKQFVAVGTHPSGARYEWAGGLPCVIPRLTLEQFNDLWDALALEFALEGVVEGAVVTTRKQGERVAREDRVAEILELTALGEDKQGALLIQCPWEREHSSGQTGDGSTVWFRAGTNGYERGHFHCLHAHCAGRTDEDFLAAVGLQEDTVSLLPMIVGETVEGEVELPAFTRDKHGRIEATIENVYRGVGSYEMAGFRIGYDEFRDAIMLRYGVDDWQEFTDTVYVQLRIDLEARGFKPISRDMVRDAVALEAVRHTFDSAQLWLGGLVWDGVPRVSTFLTDCFGAVDSDYSRAVATYMWTAMAGRVLSPGIKCDMVPVLVGAQGAGKSSGVAAIVPHGDHFAEISFQEKDDDLSRKMRGCLVAEIAELRGINSKDQESIKAFVTKQRESWIPKFKEFRTTFARRLLFIGTTNETEFLADRTGNRRWLPVRTFEANIDLISSIRNQLWAEGAALFKDGGIAYKQAETLARAEHEQYQIRDTWQHQVTEWLKAKHPLTEVAPVEKGYVTVDEVLTNCLGFEQKQISRREEMRITNILADLQYVKNRRFINGAQIRVWETIPF